MLSYDPFLVALPGLGLLLPPASDVRGPLPVPPIRPVYRSTAPGSCIGLSLISFDPLWMSGSALPNRCPAITSSVSCSRASSCPCQYRRLGQPLPLEKPVPP